MHICAQLGFLGVLTGFSRAGGGSGEGPTESHKETSKCHKSEKMAKGPKLLEKHAKITLFVIFAIWFRRGLFALWQD